MVSPEMAKKDPSWWQDDRYAIYDLSVNSATAYPQHNEELAITTPEATYTARGYAYGGGGRRITRVEISLDSGKCMSITCVHLSKLTSNPQLGDCQISIIQKTNIVISNHNYMAVGWTCTRARVASVGASGL